MDFVPHDQNEQELMLKRIGVESIEELFKDISPELLVSSLNLQEALSEPDLLEEFTELAKKNKTYKAHFLGAGSYYHYIPSLVDFVISRSQLYSAYTPYQAEASQGMLQAIYEFQSIVTRLTGLEVANASMYDAASACAEACTMAHFITRKRKVLLLEGIHPEYIATIKTYLWGRNLEYEIIKLEDLESKLTPEIAGVLFQNPNFFGDIIDAEEIIKRIRSNSKKAIIIQAISDPIVLGVLKKPGEIDVDILVSEGTGLPPSFGGPNLGIFATKQKYMRKMPGRLIGKTKEMDGDREGFVLTLQAREQHIRREKALSNICSNQSLCMIACLVYFISLGKTGLREIAMQNFQKAHYLKSQIQQLESYAILNEQSTYNEFVIQSPNPEKVHNLCEKYDFLPPLDLQYYYPDRKGQLLVCVTETVKKEELDKFVQILKEAAL